MNNYEIVIESTCDLNKSLREKFHIYPEYIRGSVYLPNNQEILSDLEWENISSSEFYKIVKKNVGDVKTAFGTYSEFERVIKPILDEKKDAMIFTISTGISGTFNAMRNYVDILLEDYPDRKIVVIDTLKYSAGSGLLAILAAKNRDEGMDILENENWCNKHRFNIHEMGVLDDLRFLAKNGRISMSKAFFGSLIGVQPVADFTRDGKTSPLGNLKGIKLADEFSLKYLLETIEDLENQIVFIAHSDRLERANLFKEQLLKVAKPKEVIIIEVGESCGPNIGPGICTYFYLGKELSQERQDEIALYNKIKETL